MSHAFIDRSQQNNENTNSDSTQKKIDPLAQLKWIENALKAPSWNASAVQPAQLSAEEEMELQMKRQPAFRWSARDAQAVQRTAEEEKEIQMKWQPKPSWGVFNLPPAQMFTQEEEELQAKQDDEVQLKAKGNTVQLVSEEEEALQGKSIQKKGNNTGLPDNLKSGIENLSGYSLDDVKVHYNSDKPAQVQAHAYAQGANIYVAPGMEKHLAHEAWHIVQQMQGRVKPTMQAKGMNINNDTGLEKEADAMGARALNEDKQRETTQFSGLKEGNSNTIQRVWKTMGPGRLKWDRILGGLQWFFHRNEDKFSYIIMNNIDISEEDLPMVEKNERALLSEDDLDQLGFQEIDFEEGDDRVEYEAPQPQFGPVDVSMVTKMGERELVDRLTQHLKRQTIEINYDRLSYINAFLIFMNQNIFPTIDEALAAFDISGPKLLNTMKGGHCGALSGSLLEECQAGPGAYLVASKLPANFQQKGAPEYCHVAAMIRFQSPDDALDEGLILLEPGFNITTPIVIKKGKVTPLPQGEETWDFSVNENLTEVTCQPRPTDTSKVWNAKKSRQTKMTYRTDVFLNPDMSLTVPLLKMDGRPQILARDEDGGVVAVIAINYAKKQIELRIGTKRYTPFPFAEVDKEGVFLGDALEPLAELLKMPADILVRRLFEAVTWSPRN